MPTNKRMGADTAEAVVVDSDRELVDRVSAGDELAFRQLYRRHSPRLYLFVLRLLGGAEAEAEDVVQDTWLKATERLSTFRWEASFGSWLTAIGLNVAREQLRRRGRRREDSWEEEDYPAVQAPERIELMDLERAIRDLPDGYRTVLMLHDVEGYRHDEIAGQLGISVGTSKSQLHHARRRVRTALNGVRKDTAI
jgi:RNA polymerase sigma factor (sigma-70 family)